MRVAIVTDIYYPKVNGISVFTQRLAVQLRRRCHETLVIAPSRTINNEDFIREGIKVFGVRSIPILLYPGYRWPILLPGQAVERRIRQFRPDVIHLQTHFALGRAALRAGRKFNVPVLGTNHFMPENLTHYLHLPRPAEEIVKRWCWRYCLRAYKELEVVTTPTPKALALIREIGYGGKGQIISNGVDLELFSPRNKNCSRIGDTLPQGLKILFVGRLDKEKKIGLAIHAFAEATKKVDAYFVIAGSGPQEDKLRKIANELGVSDRIVFTGLVPDRDLPALYGAVDAFIMPGTAELQSIAGMEAMATGLPVIAAAAVALPELVRDGINGFLFKPDDKEHLASCIATLLSDARLRSIMGWAGLREIQKHDIHCAITSFEALYMALLKKRPASAINNTEVAFPDTVET